MPRLSFTKGKPIAIIKGGKYNGEIIHIYDEYIENGTRKTRKRKAKKMPDNRMLLLDDVFFKKLMKGNGKISIIEKEKLRRAIQKNKEPADERLSLFYKKAQEMLKKKENREIIIYDGEIVPIPNPKGRECIYVAGPSGSGKSYWCGKYGKQYKKLFKKSDVVVLSRLDDDKPLDDLKPLRVPLDQGIIDEPISPEEVSNALVIFDDTDTVPDKKIYAAVEAFKNDLLETGRHHNVYVVITSHLINNFRSTRRVLNEAHSIVIYPSSGSSYQIKYCLEKYFGISKEDIARILKLPSRHVQIFKGYPQTVMYQTGVYLLGE